jgi:hypothetical protein
MRALITALALALVLGSAATASAQMSPAPEPAPTSVGTTVSPGAGGSSGPTVWGILGGWYGGFGVGARYMVPLPIKPLITQGTARDNFALEFGADFMTFSYGYAALGDYRWNAVLPVVGAMWNVWLNEKLAFYPKLDLGYFIGWYSGWNSAWGNQPTHGGFFWNVALGGMYRLSDRVALRGELGYAGLKVGASFLF